MPTIAELTIKVNTTDLDRANSSLDKVSKTAQKTSTTVNQSADEFSKLRGEIDPAAAAMDRLNKQQDRLKLAFARGTVPVDEYTRLNSMVEMSRKRINDLGAQTGKTAKEINFAMRGLPAQFTDIFVSLQGGQAPLTVFLQQGGQIKDMFGGIGPALRAMGGYILSLINPLSVAAAAMGTLAVGFVLGAKESSSFNKSLISTGNAAGTTAGNLLNLTEQLDNTLTTSGKAAQVLNQIAASGKITEASFGRVAEAAIRWEKATGTATDETVKAFVSLRGDPVKAVEELDEKYNFLTGSIYQQIAALQEQGRTSEASALAEQELANAFIERSQQIEQNLGYIERAWNFVASAAKEGWDAILDVGRQESPQKMLSDLYGELNNFGRAAFARNNPGENVQSQITELWANIADAESKALFDRIDKQIKDNSIAGQKIVNATLRDAKTNAEKEKEALVELDKAVADSRRDGIIYSEEQIEKAREAIRKKYEDKSQSRKKTEVVREDAATRLLAQMKQQEASLTQQLDSSTKISSEETKLIKLKEQISQIEQKNLTEKLTKEQASILANKEALLAQQQKNVEIQKEIQSQKELARLETIRTATANQLAADQQKYQDQVVGAGRSDKEVERMKERLTLQREYNRQMEQLSRDRRNKEISEETYQSGAQEYKRSLDERTAALEASYAKMDQIQSDWSVGASKAWENYLEEGRNVAGMTQGFFTSAFSTIEDSLVSFVTTGKLSFKDLTVSILKDLAAMATKIAANQILTSIIGSFGGGVGFGALGAATTSGYSTGSFVTQANGGAWQDGVQYFANGGAFTNSIVNTPTAFGTGRGLGVMGEAGPEAIVPLTRTSDGQLGVKSIGGGSSVVAPVNVSIQMTGNEGGANSTSTNTEGNGRNVQYAIKGVVEQAINMALKPGGSIWSAMNGR